MKITDLYLETTSNTHLEIFVDMDGVLADLFNHVAQLHDVEHYNQMTNDQWEVFFKNTDAHDLFANLPVFPTANALLELTQRYGGYNILSSPLNYDKQSSIKGKREWLQKHITVPAKKIIFEHEKYLYAKSVDGQPNILIDDYGVNIKKWNAAGGIAIKYQADQDSLADLEDQLRQAVYTIQNKQNKISKDTTKQDHESPRIHNRTQTKSTDSEPMLDR